MQYHFFQRIKSSKLFINSFSFLMMMLLSACGDDATSSSLLDAEFPADSARTASYFSYAPNSHIKISEVMPANADFRDRFGKSSGWIEVVNLGPDTIDLAGLALSESADTSDFWSFGEQKLGPGAYTLVFASGEDLKEVQGALPPLEVISDDVSAWADDQASPPGGSSWDYYEFPGALSSMVDGSVQLSVELDMEDNTGVLSYSNANLTMDLTEGTDVSQYSKATFEAKISEGKTLQVSFCDPSTQDWECWFSRVEGTGTMKEYDIELATASFDKENFYRVRMEPAWGHYDPIQFTVKSIRFAADPQFQHSSFKLERDGGELFLFDLQKFEILSHVEYPPLKSQESFGLKPERFNEYVFLDTPSPGMANFGASRSSVRMPALGFPAPGFYSEAVHAHFALPADSSGKTLYFTTDGSIPGPDNQRSRIWDGTAIVLDTTAVLRAVWVDRSGVAGPVITKPYFIEETHDLPVVSLSFPPDELFDPDTGMYMPGPNAQDSMPHYGANFWKEEEQPVSISFFEEDGSLAWSHNAGIRIFGNYSRMHPKKSLSVHFRDQYNAPKLHYNLFPEFPYAQEFNSFILRNSGNNMPNDHMRDALTATLIKGLGVDYQKYRPAVVYMNEKYWGIQNIREKLTADYFETNYGIPESQLTLIKTGSEAQSGFLSDYEDFLDLTDDLAFGRIELTELLHEMDLNSFLNYLITEVFVANQDWPANNFKVWKAQSAPYDVWRWVIYDTDFGYGFMSEYDDNMMDWITNTSGPDWPNGASSTRMIRNLLSHSDVQRMFINRALVLIQRRFSSDSTIATAESIWRSLGDEEARDLERWEHSASHWNSEKSAIKTFLSMRPYYFVEHIRSHFDCGPNTAVDVSVTGGRLLIEGLDVGDSFQGDLFAGTPVLVEAVSTEDSQFAGWSDGASERVRMLLPNEMQQLQADF